MEHDEIEKRVMERCPFLDTARYNCTLYVPKYLPVVKLLTQQDPMFQYYSTSTSIVPPHEGFITAGSLTALFVVNLEHQGSLREK
jgi:hypothetical protein